MIDEYMFRAIMVSYLFAVACVAVGVILVRLVVLLFYWWCKVIVDFKQRRFERREDDRETS